jgi:hypothetical protein
VADAHQDELPRVESPDEGQDASEATLGRHQGPRRRLPRLSAGAQGSPHRRTCIALRTK